MTESGATNTSASGNWDSYLCAIDGKPASILVDLSLMDAAPMPDFPLLGHAGFAVAAPDAWGFPGEAEYEKLSKAEDALTGRLLADGSCIYAGRSMSDGRFDCFFYLKAGAAQAWLERVRECAGESDSGVSDDPGWDCYRAFLYPDARDLLAMANRRACESLAEQGDDPEQSRAIEHMAEFAAEADALAFSEAARGLGFTPAVPESLDEAESGETGPLAGPLANLLDGPLTSPLASLPIWRVRFSRPDRPADLDETTCSLAELAERHGGVYRGWSAPVVA